MTIEKVIPKKKSRQVKRNPNEDLLNELTKGNALHNPQSKETFERLKKIEEAKQSEDTADKVFSDIYSLEAVLLGYMRPQEDNPRYLPVGRTSGEINEIEKLTDCIVCEKGILENRLNDDNPRKEVANETIEYIKELSDSIKSEGLIEPIIVWQKSTTSFPIIAGHCRYYALRYLYGTDRQVRVHVYLNKPENVGLLRFIENTKRENLSTIDSIASFEQALKEITPEFETCESKGERSKLIAKRMGLSLTHYYRFYRIYSRIEILQPLLLSISVGMNSLENFISQVEKENKGNEDEALMIAVKEAIAGGSLTYKPNEVTLLKTHGAGPRAKYFSIPKLSIEQPEQLKTLLFSDVSQINCGVNWEQLDFNDPKMVKDALKKLINNLFK